MDEDAVVRQRAAFQRRFDRLVDANQKLTEHRTRLVLRVSGLTGEPWEDVMASLGGVDMNTARDPRPSAALWEQRGPDPDSEAAARTDESSATGRLPSVTSVAPTSEPQLPRDWGQDQDLLPADLHQEDDDGNNWTLIERAAFDPSRVYPGALMMAGTRAFHSVATVLGTQLFETDDARQLVLVTFRPGLA